MCNDFATIGSKIVQWTGTGQCLHFLQILTNLIRYSTYVIGVTNYICCLAAVSFDSLVVLEGGSNS